VPVWGIDEQLDAIFSHTSVACRALLTIAASAIQWRFRRDGGFELSHALVAHGEGSSPARLAVHRTGPTQTSI
jgi:hypothetical protein